MQGRQLAMHFAGIMRRQRWLPMSEPAAFEAKDKP
jgi:hypothetical protein